IVKPFGALSLSIGSLSAAVATGGGATGASFFAASVSGRPVKGEPGGNGAGCCAAAAGGACCCAAGGGAACCCAAAGGVAASNVPRVPASTRAHGREKWVMMVLPEPILRCALSLDLHRGPRVDEPPFDRSRLQSRSSACRPWPRHSAPRLSPSSPRSTTL